GPAQYTDALVQHLFFQRFGGFSVRKLPDGTYGSIRHRLRSDVHHRFETRGKTGLSYNHFQIASYHGVQRLGYAGVEGATVVSPHLASINAFLNRLSKTLHAY